MAEDAAAPSGEPGVLKMSCGSSHTVALLDCNLVASWGRGEDGQLGHGDAEQLDAPRAVAALLDADVSAVVCGAEYTVAVSAARRQVYSWGWGDFGRLGHGDCSDVFVPRQIEFFAGVAVRQVACGDTHTLVCTDAGELFTFGRNQNGQLGLGHTNDVLAPARVEALASKAVTSVAAGAEHSVAATADDEVYAWGWGRYGNLGDGERVDRHAPVRVAVLDGQTPIKHVACGWRHSAAVARDGRVFAWGWSKYGQLGMGDADDRLVPTLVPALAGRRIRQIAGGWRHTMALDEAGAVLAWGWGKFGQLGLGDADDRLVPTEVAALAAAPVALLACGWRHTVAVTQAGEVYAWGRGVNGQLGLGNERDECVPRVLRALCRGVASRQALLADAARPGGAYVAPSDRYAVVPGGGGDGDDAAAAEAQEGALLPGLEASAAGAASGDGLPSASKKQRVAAPAGALDDAAVPEG